MILDENNRIIKAESTNTYRRKIMKKFLIVVLAAIVATVSLFGCADDNMPEPAKQAEVKSELASTFIQTSGSPGSPSVVTEIASRSAFDALDVNGVRPASVIVRAGADGNAKAVNGETLGTLAEAYDKFGGKIIPIFRAETDEEADALIKFYKEKYRVVDSAVLSSTPGLVKRVKGENSEIRGIIGFAATETPENIVKTLAENCAITALLSENASVDTIRYIQARFMTAWVRSGADVFSVAKTAANGAYGVVTDDYATAYDAFKTFGKYDVLRTAYNVAHRGLPKTHNENSVSGISAAIAAGATHVELDCYLTTDGEVVLMHDSDISRTTDGAGNIESMTLAELRTNKLDVFGEEDVPTLSEAIDAFAGSDAIMVLELKSSKPELAEKIKAVVEAKDFYENFVVISFSADNIAKAREVMPRVPAALLVSSVREDKYATTITAATALGAALDADLGSATLTFNRTLCDRGIAGWYWTYDDALGVKYGRIEGYTGLTNNDATAFTDWYKTLEIADVSLPGIEKGDEITAVATTYAGEKKEVAATVIEVVGNGGTYEVIVAASDMQINKRDARAIACGSVKKLPVVE